MTELKKMLENFFLKKNSKTFENRNPGVISLHCHSNNKVLLLREKDAFTSRKRPFYSEKAKRALRDSPMVSFLWQNSWIIGERLLSLHR